MAIPNKIVKFKALEEDLSTSVATALWKKAADLADYINASVPIGMIMYFHATQELLTDMPDTKYWKEVDGTAVNNVLSPMHGVTLPEMRWRFHKHPADGVVVFTTGGADTRNFAHNHGGRTHDAWNGGDYDTDDNNERAAPFTHSHAISTSLGVVDIKPLYRELRVYVRIL